MLLEIASTKVCLVWMCLTYLCIILLLICIVRNWSFLISKQFLLNLHCSMQSQEVEVKMILSLCWSLIMNQFIEESSPLLGEREELRKWISLSLMERSPKILKRKELPFLQFSVGRLYPFCPFTYITNSLKLWWTTTTQ